MAQESNNNVAHFLFSLSRPSLGYIARQVGLPHRKLTKKEIVDELTKNWNEEIAKHVEEEARRELDYIRITKT